MWFLFIAIYLNTKNSIIIFVVDGMFTLDSISYVKLKKFNIKRLIFPKVKKSDKFKLAFIKIMSNLSISSITPFTQTIIISFLHFDILSRNVYIASFRKYNIGRREKDIKC